MGLVPSLGLGETYNSAICMCEDEEKSLNSWQSQAPQDCIRGKESFWVSGSQSVESRCGISITWELVRLVNPCLGTTS